MGFILMSRVSPNITKMFYKTFFWEMLRDNKANVTPSQIIDPVDKTTIIDKKGKIEKCLVKLFGDIGRDSKACLDFISPSSSLYQNFL
jgi:hypothetical protein